MSPTTVNDNLEIHHPHPFPIFDLSNHELQVLVQAPFHTQSPGPLAHLAVSIRSSFTRRELQKQGSYYTTRLLILHSSGSDPLARDEFALHGMTMVELSHRNVCQQGFALLDEADAGKWRPVPIHLAHLTLTPF